MHFHNVLYNVVACRHRRFALIKTVNKITGKDNHRTTIHPCRERGEFSERDPEDTFLFAQPAKRMCSVGQAEMWRDGTASSSGIHNLALTKFLLNLPENRLGEGKWTAEMHGQQFLFRFRHKRTLNKEVFGHFPRWQVTFCLRNKYREAYALH